MTVRELVYTLVSTDPELNGYGFVPTTTFANGAPDSPPDSGNVFLVLNWGPERPGVPGQRGRDRASLWDCEAWFYTRDSDYGIVNAAIKRWRAILDAIEAVRTGAQANDGWLISTDWQGDGRDGWDDVYRANYRISTYTIIASGD